MEVLSISPANSSENIPLETVIEIAFDEEVDRDSLQEGSLIIKSEASRAVFEGPESEDFIATVHDNYLTSDVFTGIVDGAISTEDGLTISFTPTRPLTPNTVYTVVVGTNLVSRTLGAPEADPANTGTGSITLLGPYTDTEDDTFTIEILSTGALGTASFMWTRSSTGMATGPVVTDRLVELEDGVFIKFLAGSYAENDIFTFEASAPTKLEDIYSTSFSTGSPTYLTPPVEAKSVKLDKREVQGLLRIDDEQAVDSDVFRVVSITPFEGQSNVSLSQQTITIEFNKNIDADSLTDTVIEVLMENLPMDELQQMSVPLVVRKTVSGKKLILKFQG